jgi:hypothetical protein
MSRLWKWITVGIVLGAIGGYIGSTKADPINFNNSPLNWANSPLNFDNSPLNFNNSPLNWANSPLNVNATNGVYDTNGNRVGYTTVSPHGTVNIFGSDGNRTGYAPAPTVSVPLVPLR